MNSLSNRVWNYYILLLWEDTRLCKAGSMSYGLTYADANADYNSADIVIYGIPYDHTSCFRSGSREAPNAIRQASYNFEEMHFEHGINQTQLKIYDYGNCDDFIFPDQMFEEINFAIHPAIYDKKFIIAIGGEHSITIPIVQNFRRDDIALISIDAHLDSRDDYLGVRNSHACVTRRTAEYLSLDNVYVLGCRSIGREELERDDVISFISSYDIMDRGIKWAINKAIESVKNERIYLSIDIDGIDPAFAPGTGTPEPFGITPMDVKKVINEIGDRLASFDIVEVCPPLDPTGITSILAARYVNEAIAVYTKNIRR